MKLIYKLILKYIARQIVSQGSQQNIIDYYKIIQKSSVNYYKDTYNTHNIECLLKDCHQEALIDLWKDVPNAHICRHCRTVNTTNQYCRTCGKTQWDQ